MSGRGLSSMCYKWNNIRKRMSGPASESEQLLCVSFFYLFFLYSFQPVTPVVMAALLQRKGLENQT